MNGAGIAACSALVVVEALDCFGNASARGNSIHLLVDHAHAALPTIQAHPSKVGAPSWSRTSARNAIRQNFKDKGDLRSRASAWYWCEITDPTALRSVFYELCECSGGIHLSQQHCWVPGPMCSM